MNRSVNKSVAVSALLLLSFYGSTVLGQSAPPTSTVTFHVIDEDGLSVFDCEVISFTDRKGHDYASLFRDLKASGVAPRNIGDGQEERLHRRGVVPHLG